MHKLRVDLSLSHSAANALLDLARQSPSDIGTIISEALEFKAACVRAARTGNDLIYRDGDGRERSVMLDEPVIRRSSGQ